MAFIKIVFIVQSFKKKKKHSNPYMKKAISIQIRPLLIFNDLLKHYDPSYFFATKPHVVIYHQDCNYFTEFTS